MKITLDKKNIKIKWSGVDLIKLNQMCRDFTTIFAIKSHACSCCYE